MEKKIHGKTIVIVVANEYEDIELLYPILRLSEAGGKVIVVAHSLGNHPRPWLEHKPVSGRFGHPLPVPVMPPGRHYSMKTLDEIQADQLDCLLFPGGFSPDYLRRDERVLKLVADAHQKGKVLAAICHAPWVFISAKVVKGKRMTGVSAVKDDLINAGAIYVDEAVVRDGNIITSRKPDDLPEFCQAIISALSS